MATRTPTTADRIERSAGWLATQSVARMEADLPWFLAMPAEQRSRIGLVAQAGIASFVEWLRRPDAGPELSTDVFAAAPRELTRAVSLQQVVELLRVIVGVVETHVGELAAPGGELELRESVLRYSREIAFAAALVYAQAAEERGAWDARLESLVLDAVLRGESDDALLSRAAALGWRAPERVHAVVGLAPDSEPEIVIEAVQRAGRRAGVDILAGVQGRRLVVLVGVRGGAKVLDEIVGEFGPGPVVVGPGVPELAAATESVAAASAALRAAPAWPGAPRPVPADALLAERALAGDDNARRALVEEVYKPLAEAPGDLLGTVAAYVDGGFALETAARALFVHPNTVRYRLRRASEITGLALNTPRDGFVAGIALALGRLADGAPQL